MNLFSEALNRPAEAFRRRSGRIAWIFVIVEILIVTVFDQVINYAVHYADYEVSIDVWKMSWMAGAGIATYLAACVLFWLVCKAFGSAAALPVYIKTWGISYFPTILCAVAVSLAETYFTVFWNSSIWGLLLNVVFVAILIWKIVLYVIFLREVADIKGKKLAGAFVVCGIGILALAGADLIIGLKTPIL